jgi:hypothetical protein
MQKDIHYYEKLIQEKRKKTPWREFVKEIASWDIMNIYKQDGEICRYPKSDRISNLGDDVEFWDVSASHERSFDAEKSLFGNMRLLQDAIPLQRTLRFGTNENCEYMDGVLGAKNVYLSFIICFDAENILYSAFCYANISNIINSFLVCKNSSEVADSMGVTESYKVFYSKNIANSSNIWFSTNLIGCHDCIWCDGIENQRYMINNQQFSQDIYNKKKVEILSEKSKFESIRNHIFSRPTKNFASKNVTGEGVIKSENIENGLWVWYFSESRNVAIGNGDSGSRNHYDSIDVGYNAHEYYGVIGGGGSNSKNIYCSMQMATNSDCYYCMHMIECHHCLGCIGLKNKSYCILNKQYTKEEWEEKACEIFASMEADGTLGDFFPASMNPFYFNDTLAYLIDDTFTKEEVEAEGYLWRDEPIRADIPEWMKIIKNTELDQFQGFRETPFAKGDVTKWQGDLVSEQNPQSATKQADSSFTKELTWYIDPEILNVVISDEKWNYYRIVKMEYDFLMKHGLPLPTMHWLERMKMGFR